MLVPVTIAARRRVYWSLFILSCACLGLFATLFWPIARGSASPGFLERGHVLGEYRISNIKLSSHIIVAAGTGLCAIYSAFALGLILYSFRKTVSAEVFFFAFWVLSVGTEVFRLGAYTLASDGAAVNWQILMAKTILFCRYSGNFCLLASGLHAAGYRNEKFGTAIALIVAAAFALASAMPVNTGSFAPTFELRPGYSQLNDVFAILVGLVTVANFLYAAGYSGERSYRLVALGSAALLAGHRLLVTQSNPFALVLGFALLVSGSWLFVSRLHSYYLWQ